MDWWQQFQLERGRWQIAWQKSDETPSLIVIWAYSDNLGDPHNHHCTHWTLQRVKRTGPRKNVFLVHPVYDIFISKRSDCNSGQSYDFLLSTKPDEGDTREFHRRKFVCGCLAILFKLKILIIQCWHLIQGCWSYFAMLWRNIKTLGENMNLGHHTQSIDVITILHQNNASECRRSLKIP